MRGCRCGSGLKRRFPPVMLLPGHMQAQEARCPAVGNWVMSTPISAIRHSAARRATPGMLSRWSRARAKGGYHLLDAVVEELADGVFELEHVFQPEPQHHRMMVTKPPAQRLPQRGQA